MMSESKSSRGLTLENIYDGKVEKSKSFNRSNTVETTSKLRMDKFGNIISKKNSSKYKICFVDQVEKDKNLVEVHRVESYKQYNQMESKKTSAFGMDNCLIY